MKLYQGLVQGSHVGTMLVWDASKRGVARRARELVKALHRPAVEGLSPEETASFDPATDIREVLIPTDRAGLIEWLNANLTTDND